MEFSDWLSCNDKPYLNGVYQCRDLSKPDSPITYSLYRKGWHVDCATKEEAARSIEKRAGRKLQGMGLELREMFKVNAANDIQWRGLAKRPPGAIAEVNDNWTKP
jgi:hypothetical protein